MRRSENKGVVLTITLSILLIAALIGVGISSLVHYEGLRSQQFESKVKATYLARAGINVAFRLLEKDDQNVDSYQDNWRQHPDFLKLSDLEQIELYRGVDGPPIGKIRGGFDITYAQKENGNIEHGIIDENSKIKFSPENIPLLMRYLGMPEEALNDQFAKHDTSIFNDEKRSRYLTSYGSGLININTAPFEVLRCLPYLDEFTATSIINYRAGEDQAEGTKDDVIFLQKSDLRKVSGITGSIFRGLEKYIDVRSDTFQVISLGTVKHKQAHIVKHHIKTIVERTAQTLNIQFWYEI